MNPLADKLRKLADGMEDKIQHLSRPMTQNPTPKRNREYRSGLHDARNMERTQKALRALADLHHDFRCPAELGMLRTKDDIGALVRVGLSGRGGYYDVIEDDDYAVKTPQARMLQALIDGSAAQKAEREEQRKHGELMASIALGNFPGYFPTPEELARRAADLADIQEGQRVLEPEVGTGELARAIFAAAPVHLVAIEQNGKLLEGFRGSYRSWGNSRIETVHGDFMEETTETLGFFDRIVMNPPFEKGADIKHIQHAARFLAPGGRIVAICANGPRQNEILRPIVEEAGGTWEVIPAGTFKKSGTNVATVLLSFTSTL